MELSPQNKTLAVVFALFSAAICFFSLRQLFRPTNAGSGFGHVAVLSQKWSIQLGGRVEHGLALSDDGSIIAASLDGFVYSIAPEGSLQWKTFIGTSGALPTVGPDGAVYIINDSGAVFAL